MQYSLINPEKFYAVFSKPLWYLEFSQLPEVQQAFYGENENIPIVRSWDDKRRKFRRDLRKEIYHIVLEAYLQNKIVFGTRGFDRDAARKPVDTVVIHCHETGRLSHNAMLSVIPLIVLYAWKYISAEKGDEKYHQAIWSNHFDSSGKITFWSYHWVIKEDGTLLRCLKDNEIGWQAGNMDTNQRSVAICLPANFAQDEPDDKILDKVAGIINVHYSYVPKENIIGHCEVDRDPQYTNTIYCPGKHFLSSWKAKLLAKL